MARADAHMQIGEVAERTGLSLRTIRYYGEVGMVVPSARSPGGFRLFAESDVERLLLVKRMKPLGFSVDDMRELLSVLDRLAAEDTEGERTGLLTRLAEFEEAAAARCAALREQLTIAEEFSGRLRDERRKHEDMTVSEETERR